MITATHSLVIVKPGEGVVDTVKLVERFRNGELDHVRLWELHAPVILTTRRREAR